MPIDLSEEIDGFPADKGLMRPPEERTETWTEDLPEAIQLLRHHAPWCFTTETPSTAANIVDRVACHGAVIQAGVNWLLHHVS